MDTNFRIVGGYLGSPFLWNVVDAKNNILASFHGPMSACAAHSFYKDLCLGQTDIPPHNIISQNEIVEEVTVEPTESPKGRVVNLKGEGR